MIDRPDWSKSTEQAGTALVPASAEPPAAAPSIANRVAREDWGSGDHRDGTSVPATRGGTRRPDWGPSAPPNVRHTDAARHAEWRDEDRPSGAPSEVSEEADDDIDHQLDAEELRSDRNMLQLGISREAIAELRGRAPEDIGKLRVSRRSIDAEIAAIEKRMREDRRAYSKDEAQQARYRALLEQRANLPAKVKVGTETQGNDQGDAPGINPDLLAQWAREGGVETNLRQVQATAQTVLDALEPDEAGALEEGFDALPEAARSAVYAFLAVQGGGAWPAASDAALQDFASTDEGAELVQGWGRQASRKVGIVKGRMGLMLNGMTPEDRSKAQLWFDGLSSQQAKAVLAALAGR